MMIQPCGQPFRHWVIDDVAEVAPVSQFKIPHKEWKGWIHYNNDCENKKRTTNQITEIQKDLREIFSFLISAEWIAQLRNLTGLGELQGDPGRWGAGLHVSDPGGWLNCHLDYALHPSGLERRINAIAFLNDHWEESWGGRFQLWDDSAREVMKSIAPKPRRMVVWESSDLAYHGTERTSLSSSVRITAAAWYLAPARPGCTRKRALFVPNRQPS